LPYGSFVEEYINAENIVVAAGNDANVTVELNSDGNLRIGVKNYNPYWYDETTPTTYPIAKIPANATTFNIVIYVYVGSGYSYSLKTGEIAKTY
jgi:hypothetical protein